METNRNLMNNLAEKIEKAKTNNQDTEFKTLSEKREKYFDYIIKRFPKIKQIISEIELNVYSQDKEFIRLLKEELDNRIISNTANEICKEIINKVFGDKLT